VIVEQLIDRRVCRSHYPIALIIIVGLCVYIHIRRHATAAAATYADDNDDDEVDAFQVRAAVAAAVENCSWHR